MHSARFGLLASILLLNVPVWAQQIQPTATSDSNPALVLLRASLSAQMGSAVAIPNSLIASGTLAHVTGDNPAPYPVRLYMQETNKFRWEEDLPEGPVATVINGEKAQSQSVSATDSLAPWQVGGKRLENFPMFLLARWLNANSTQATFVGQETIDGQMRNHISVVEPWQQRRPPDPWRRDGNRGHYEIWIDPVSSLPARLRYYQDTDDAQLFSLVPMEMLYSDFHNIGGSVFPFTVTRCVADRVLNVLRLDVVKPDSPVTDLQFQIK